MKHLTIDFSNKSLCLDGEPTLNLHTPEAFDIVKKLWEYTNWVNKYSYNFTWLGRPIIQLPDDMLRIQEIIYSIKPSLIIETGVAHGGSLIYYASLLKLLGKGKVIGVDIDIRPDNRKAIENHALSDMITLLEGSSIAGEIVNQVKKRINSDDVTLVILDSCHTKEHVLKELDLYSVFVSLGSYIIVADGVMQEVADAPQAKACWAYDNPQQAAIAFLEKNKNFIIEQWSPIFKESNVGSLATYYPKGFLKRISTK